MIFFPVAEGILGMENPTGTKNYGKKEQIFNTVMDDDLDSCAVVDFRITLTSLLTLNDRLFYITFNEAVSCKDRRVISYSY